MKYNDQIPYLEHSDYDRHFWNAMRGKDEFYSRMEHGKDSSTGTYVMAPISNDKYMKELKKESLFRNICTVITTYAGDFRIFAKDCDALAEWVPEGCAIPIADTLDDFTISVVDSYKLGVFLKTDEDFVRDASFDFERYLTERLACSFARAEDKAFTTGSGEGMPTGIVCPGKGATEAVSTAALCYDDVIKLFFSVKPEYRRNGIWLMNDETALVLRTMKDKDGNYLWNQTNDTILGKPVMICEYMPSIAAGAMPIVFGDFRYYWIIGRQPISVRTLTERFVVNDQIGHLAFEFLDGKLIRRDAIHGLVIQTTE